MREGASQPADDEALVIEARAASVGDGSYAVAGGPARDAYERAEGDVQRAADLLLAEASLDQELSRALLRLGCYLALSQIRRQKRSQIWNDTEAMPSAVQASRSEPVAQTNGAAPSHKARLLATAEHRLMSFVMPGGKGLALGDATRADVLAAAREYETKSADMSVKARWMHLIAKAMKSDSSTVSSALTEAKLRRLRERARDGAN